MLCGDDVGQGEVDTYAEARKLEVDEFWKLIHQRFFYQKADPPNPAAVHRTRVTLTPASRYQTKRSG